MTREKAQWFAEEGSRLYEKGDYQGSIDNYDKALVSTPDDAALQVVRTFALNKLGRYAESIQTYNKILVEHPDWVVLRNFRSDCQLQSGHYQESIESCEDVLKQYPEDSWAWKTKTEAIRLLDEWLRPRRPPNAYVELYELVGSTEKRLHIFIRQRLQKCLGPGEAEWWAKGVPKDIRTKCAQRKEDDPRRENQYNYTDLVDLKDILKQNWKIFESDFQRIRSEFKSRQQKELLSDLVRLNEIRNRVMHPVRSLPTGEDIDFARRVRELVEKFSSPG